MGRTSRWTLDPLTWTTLGAVAVTALTGIAVTHVDLTPAQRFWIVLLVAAATIGSVLLQVFRRYRALMRLEQAAAQMLSAGIPRKSVGQEAPALSRLDGPEVPPEFLPLGAALFGLGQRIEVQLKDLAKKGRNLEALIDAIDEPILATDDRERVLMCNRSAEGMFDAPPGGLTGRSIRDLFTQAQVLEMHAAARDGQTRRERVKLTTPVGTRVFQITATPLPAAWGNGVFGSVLALRDVTELAQAVQVKTDFVANASHELRTPVAAIRGAAETLPGAADDPEMSERLRAMILNHALKLEEMLRDLLDLSRLESPDMPVLIAPVDMHELERTIHAMSDQACLERGLTLTFQIDPAMRVIRTDRKILTLILRNLVENATKFAYEGTEVRVFASLTDTADASPGQPARAEVRFEVADKGIGIPLQHQERVFERYYQVDPGRSGSGPGAAKRGTGLGLSIVKHAAKALGGKVGLTSVWGQGTTVIVEIPVELLPAGAADAPTDHPPGPAAPPVPVTGGSAQSPHPGAA